MASISDCEQLIFLQAAFAARLGASHAHVTLSGLVKAHGSPCSGMVSAGGMTGMYGRSVPVSFVSLLDIVLHMGDNWRGSRGCLGLILEP